MHMGLGLIAAAQLTIAPVASAVQPGAMPDVHRLSDAQVTQILDSAEMKREAAPGPAAREVGGEIGFGIGTGGYREAFGTAVIPLGRTGTAIVSFDSQTGGRKSAYGHR